MNPQFHISPNTIIKISKKRKPKQNICQAWQDINLRWNKSDFQNISTIRFTNIVKQKKTFAKDPKFWEFLQSDGVGVVDVEGQRPFGETLEFIWILPFTHKLQNPTEGYLEARSPLVQQVKIPPCWISNCFVSTNIETFGGTWKRSQNPSENLFYLDFLFQKIWTNTFLLAPD